MAAPCPAHRYEFSGFQVDPIRRCLHRSDGAQVPLTPKVFDTLLFLVQHSGAVLDKERLMEAVWPDSIVEENNLSQNISTLRRVLGESPGSHRFIVTVPGRGYRFVADVKAVEPNQVEPARDRQIIGTETHGPVLPEEPASAGPGPAKARPSARGVFVAGALLLVLGVAALVLWQMRPPNPAPTSLLPGKSIAVLPFENLSPEQDDAFFAEGIQDDVLTSVGKIKNLKVIARASVTSYRGPAVAGRLREIGEALGVSHVLQGSVRRAGHRVVINVALIDTRDQQQIWSERYERTLTDSLSLQGELALEIARALRATLTSAEEASVAAKPTENTDAYLLYLRALEIESPSRLADNYKLAVSLYQSAIDLDPNFALARARLSLVLNFIYQGKVPALKAKAWEEAREAVRLQPKLGEARLAIATCYFWGERDYDRALAALSEAAELLPNSAMVPWTAAMIYKWQNKYQERMAALQRAEILDPRDTRVLQLMALTLRWVRDWPGAIRTHDRLRALLPADHLVQLASSRARDEFYQTGDLAIWKRAIAEDEKVAAAIHRDRLQARQFEVAMLERDYPAAERLLAAVSSELDEELPHPKVLHEAMLAVARGADRAAVATAFQSPLREIETRLMGRSEELGVEASDLRANLALSYLFLGRTDEAIGVTERAIELQEGQLEKNESAAVLALIYARGGKPEEAITLIEHLLTVPAVHQRGAVYSMTLTDLKWRWVWDPLRSHPRFQKLLAGPEPKTVY